MTKKERTELLGGGKPMFAIITHANQHNQKGKFEHTAGPDSENADSHLTITNRGNRLCRQIQSLIEVRGTGSSRQADSLSLLGFES